MRTRSLLTLLTALAATPANAGELDWLAGCWQSSDGSSREVWVVDNDDLLVGFSATASDGAIGFHEVLTLRRTQTGEWRYTAHPSGQAVTTFTAPRVDDNAIVFVNAGHDYPQRISYRRAGNTLIATISLADGERPVHFEKDRC